jgi:hypothetical protein
LTRFINGRFASDERSAIVAQPANLPLPMLDYARFPTMPIVLVVIPDTWDKLTDGLDGIAIDLPALKVKPTHGDLIASTSR